MRNRSLFAMLLAGFLSLASLVQATSATDNSQYLKNRIASDDKRYASYIEVLNLLNERNAKLLVETGTSRGGDSNFIGDGGSTIIFGHWAKQNGAYLFTVDIDSGALANAEQAARDYSNTIDFVCCDSITFLSEFSQQIDFLYLDSYDFDGWNPSPSQNHHLKEIEAAYDKLHDETVIMVDDCDLPYGGKGKLVIEFLLERGWKIVYEGYQVILVRN